MKPGGRYLIAIGVPTCAGMGDLPELPLVERDVRDMTDLLADQGYQRVLADEIGLGATSDTMRMQLGNWFSDAARSEDDDVIVYFAGHGDFDGNRFREHCLLTSDAEPYKMHTVFRTADFATIFFGGRVQPKNLLLILDTCFAGTGAAHTVRDSLRSPVVPGGGAGFWVIATTERDSLAIDGAFVAAFHAVLCDRHHTPQHRGAYLWPVDIVASANRWFEEHHKIQRADCAMVGAATDARFFRNPAYLQLFDDGMAESRTFWQQAASGADLPGHGGRYFSGRRIALEHAATWLADPAPAHAALVVTGLPGSGKSALIGQLLLETAPGLGIGIDAALRATGESLLSFTQKLAVALRCVAREPRQLVAELFGNERRATILIDGLDEARESERIELGLLRALADCPGIKLLIATRRFGQRIPLERDAFVLDLDMPPFFDVADLIDYVDVRLRTGDRRVRYDEADAMHARAVAAHVAQAAGTSFLYARLAARAVLALGYTVDTRLPGWQDRLPMPKDIDDAYAEDFLRFDAIKRRRFLALLLPLTHARGRGLPIGPLWLALANGDCGDQHVLDDLVALRDEAGFYLVEDEQYGKTVFRLFHQTFVDYLRQRRNASDAEVRCFAALEAYARAAQAPLRFDARTEPYIRHYFAAHAAAANRLDRCLEDPGLLATIAPADMLPVLPMTTGARDRVLAAAYKRACHWIRRGRPEAFLCHFALACADYGAGDILDQLDALDNGMPWRPLAVLGSASSSSEVYANGSEHITALALAADRQGHAVAICGYASGAVAIRSLYNDAILLELAAPDIPPALEGSVALSPRLSRTRVNYIEVLRHGDGLCIAVAGAADTLAIFEVSLDWTCTAHSLLHDVSVRAMCFAERGQTSVLVTCAASSISVWSLPCLECVASNQDASAGRIYGLAFFKQGGRNFLATANDTMRDAKVVDRDILRIWDLESLGLERKIGHEDMHLARRVCACSINGRQWLIVTDLLGNCLMVDPLSNLRHFNRTSIRQSGIIRGLGDIHHTEPVPDGAYLVSCLYERASFATLHAASGPTESPRIDIAPKDLALGSDTCRVTADGALLVVAAATQLRAYRLDELSDQPLAPTAFASFFDERRICRSVCAGAHTYLGDHLGGTACWNSDGSCRWQREARGPGVSGLALSGGDNPILVVAMSDGLIELLDPSNGALLASITLPGEVLDLSLGRLGAKPACFVILRSMADGTNYYAVRAWDLTSAMEIDTEVPPWKKLSDFGGKRALEYDTGEPRHAFCMSDYLKTKLTPCAEQYEHAQRLLMLCGGAYGEIRVFDTDTLEEIDSWSINTQRHQTAYVYAIGVTAVNGTVVVCAGNEYGGIAMHRLGEGGSTRYLDDAHVGLLTTIAVVDCEDAVFVSGGMDGVVNIWSTGLALLERIEFGVPIIQLQALGTHHLAVTLATGVVHLHLAPKHSPAVA